MDKPRHIAERVAFLFIALAALGTTFYYGNFVKIHIGPIFVLEALFLGWFFCATFAQISMRGSFALPIGLLLPAAAFCAYGLILTAIDLYSSSVIFVDRRYLLRFIQHCLIYVYPLMWIAAAVWMVFRGRVYAERVLLMILAANVAPNLIGADLENRSIGPMIVIPLLLVINRALNLKKNAHRRERVQIWTLAIILAVAAFFPFWRFWWNGWAQRTSVILLFCYLIGTPLIFRALSYSAWFKTMLIGLFLFAFGIGVTTTALHFKRAAVTPGAASDLSSTAVKNFFKTMEGNEDVPTADDPSHFQARSRRHWWKTAISDWKQNPVFGIGFVPEVPSLIFRQFKNSFENHYLFENLNPPISGPHNSYLSILARMGIVGLALFLILAVQWISRARGMIRVRALFTKGFVGDLIIPILILVPVCGAIHAFVNIGFEGPHNCMVMWLVVGCGIGFSAITKLKKG